MTQPGKQPIYECQFCDLKGNARTLLLHRQESGHLIRLIADREQREATGKQGRKCVKCGCTGGTDENGWCLTGRPYIPNQPDSNQRSICPCPCEFPAEREAPPERIFVWTEGLREYHVTRTADSDIEYRRVAHPAAAQPDATERAKQIVGTVFQNTAASHETLERVMIERIAATLAAHPCTCDDLTEVQRAQDDHYDDCPKSTFPHPGAAQRQESCLRLIEDCIRGLAQPIRDNQTATGLQVMAEQGLTAVAALRRAAALPAQGAEPILDEIHFIGNLLDAGSRRVCFDRLFNRLDCDESLREPLREAMEADAHYVSPQGEGEVERFVATHRLAAHPDQLSQVKQIVSDWADEHDKLDDLDALARIADLLGIEVKAAAHPETMQADGELTLETVLWAAANWISCPAEGQRPESDREVVLKGLHWAMELLAAEPVPPSEAAHPEHGDEAADKTHWLFKAGAALTICGREATSVSTTMCADYANCFECQAAFAGYKLGRADGAAAAPAKGEASESVLRNYGDTNCFDGFHD